MEDKRHEAGVTDEQITDAFNGDLPLKRQPLRTRHDPVGDIPTDLVDGVLKFIKTKDKQGFKQVFAARLGWSTVEAMERAHRKAMSHAVKRAKRSPITRLSAHIARNIAECDLLSQAMTRRFG